MSVGCGKHVWAPRMERTRGKAANIPEHKNWERISDASCITGKLICTPQHGKHSAE